MSYIGRKSVASIADTLTQKQIKASFKPNIFKLRTGNFNAVEGEVNLIDTSSNVITATLPASPPNGYTVEFIDVGGNLSANSLTVARNGNLVMKLAENLIVNDEYEKVRLSFIGGIYGWVLT